MNNTVILGDCMEYMATCKDNQFDLAIVDPPYGINAGKMTMGSGKHEFKQNKEWDKNIPKSEYFTELFRISKNQIIWGGNYFTEFLPVSKNWLVWDKMNPNLSFSECELAWVRDGNNMRIFKYYSANTKKDGGKIHPTQKPIALYKWILQKYSKHDYKIFDSHVGSGSIRIACHDLGFDFTGTELDLDYFNAQEARYQAHIAQSELFGKDELQGLIFNE